MPKTLFSFFKSDLYNIPSENFLCLPKCRRTIFGCGPTWTKHPLNSQTEDFTHTRHVFLYAQAFYCCCLWCHLVDKNGSDFLLVPSTKVPRKLLTSWNLSRKIPIFFLPTTSLQLEGASPPLLIQTKQEPIFDPNKWPTKTTAKKKRLPKKSFHLIYVYSSLLCQPSEVKRGQGQKSKAILFASLIADTVNISRMWGAHSRNLGLILCSLLKTKNRSSLISAEFRVITQRKSWSVFWESFAFCFSVSFPLKLLVRFTTRSFGTCCCEGGCLNFRQVTSKEKRSKFARARVLCELGLSSEIFLSKGSAVSSGQTSFAWCVLVVYLLPAGHVTAT